MANVLLAFEALKGRRERDEGDRAPPKAGVRRHDALPPRRSLYPEAERIRLVVDNLKNAFIGGLLYENFSAEVARRMSKKIEFVYTPKHGSHG
jgi:hypothetical protein